MNQWYLMTKKADFQRIAKQYGIDQVTARIIRNRDNVTDEQIEQYLEGDISQLPEPEQMKYVSEAAAIIEKKIKAGKKIRVIGDYDVDGICATYILYRGLTLCGAYVDTVLPDRVKDGYGLHNGMIEDAVRDEIDTIITCDNGIAAMEEIKNAKARKLTFIVTDHHEVPYEENEDGTRTYILPEADVVVDPKREECVDGFKEICGAYVALKVIFALFNRLGMGEEYRKELLVIAGIATVCDVMELRNENRILVRYALKMMKESGNRGLMALLEVNGIDKGEITAYQIGFVIGPCINACGRLENATLALELLKATDEKSAVSGAARLKEMNDTRKELTQDGIRQAVSKIENEGYLQDKILVIYLEQVQESIAGIIAGKIRETYERPVFILTRTENGVKGSARSVAAYSLYDEMTRCKSFFTQYGGHRMAAGLSMQEKDIDEFRRTINKNCRLNEAEFEEKVMIDAAMPISYVTESLISEFKCLEPFGNGNEKPVFAQKNIRFLSEKRMGKNRDMARFLVSDESKKRYTAILFQNLDRFESLVKEKYGEEILQQLSDGLGKEQEIYLDILYYPAVNQYMGNTTLQFIIQDFK